MVFLEYINFEHNTVAAELVRQTYDTPPLAFVHSYGCQQNVNDGERIKGVLVDIGYGLCDRPEDADLTDHLMLNFEVKYSLVSDLDQCVISLGAAYKF